MRELCPIDKPNWYALKIMPRHEKAVSRMLEAKGYECLLPLCRQTRRRSDRMAQVDVPVFPQYLISRFALTQRSDVYGTPGVIGAVGFGAGPEPLPPADVDSVSVMIASGLALLGVAGLPTGTQVRIVDGPLRGVVGAVVQHKSGMRVVVGFTLLHRAISVELDAAELVAMEAVNCRRIP